MLGIPHQPTGFRTLRSSGVEDWGKMETAEMANDKEEMGNATDKKWGVDRKRNGNGPAKEMEPKKWSQRNEKQKRTKEMENGVNKKWR